MAYHLDIDTNNTFSENIKNVYKNNKYKNIKKSDNYFDVFQNYWLIDNYIARGGLTNSDNYENTISAYQEAINVGYSILIPVQQIQSGALICFKEKTLAKATNSSGYICNLTDEKLNSLLIQGKDKIPLFMDALELIKGKVPVIIEVINDAFIGKMESKILEILKNYALKFGCEKNIAIMSANPYILNYFFKECPEFTRILKEDANKEDKFTFGINTKLIRKFKLYKITYADFIAYPFSRLPNRFLKHLAPIGIIACDVTSAEDYKKILKCSDNITFSGFIPKI